MVNILVLGKEYDKVFNYLDMLHAPLEGKIRFEDVQDIQVLKLKTKLAEDQATMDHLGISETPGDLTTGDRLSPKVKVFLIPVIGKMEMEIPGSSRVKFIATCSYPTDIILKLKKFKKDDYTSFQDKERYEHAGPKVTSSQVRKRSQDDDKRFDLADDLKEAQD
ncbi:hypothetical protein Tco_0156226 [Tanacetum coccineum]